MKKTQIVSQLSPLSPPLSGISSSSVGEIYRAEVVWGERGETSSQVVGSHLEGCCICPKSDIAENLVTEHSYHSHGEGSCAVVLSRVRLCVTSWTVMHQAPLSMRFSRQEYWSGLPFPSPGDLPDPGIEPSNLCFLWLLHWKVGSFPMGHLVNPFKRAYCLSSWSHRECLFYLECGLGREERQHIGEYINVFSILSEVWHGFLEREHSTPAENYGLEGEPLWSLLALIVQEMKMSITSGIKRSLSSNE